MTIVVFKPTYQDLRQTPMGEWVTVISEQGFTYQNIRGAHCQICLEPRPTYCNRGQFLAKLDVFDEHELHIDWADGWSPGRYYFDESRAKAEIEAWLRARNQLPDPIAEEAVWDDSGFDIPSDGGDRDDA